MSACCSTTSSAPPNPSDRTARAEGRSWFRLGVAGLIAAQSMAFGMGANLANPEGTERIVLHGALAASAILVFLLAGLPILRTAWKGACHGQINMEQFFLVGIGGAFAASLQSTLLGSGSVYYEIVAVLVAIHQLGSILGSRRRAAALEAAGRLRAAFDACWRLTCCGREERVPVTEIAIGERVVVPPGEGIPIDGVIREGEVYVRETALTGEVFPVVRRPGDMVFAGSQVEDGRLVIEALQPGAERKFDSLLQALEKARETKAPLQRMADRVVQWFLPLVVAIAVVTFFGWIGAVGWQTALMYSLAVIVVACPCALGLATPLAYWNALNRLAERGVLLKSGEALERLASVTRAVFDKTGTLSHEQPSVWDVVTAPGVERAAVKSWVAAVQAGSLHPVARSLATWAGGGKSVKSPVSIRVLPGVGVEGMVDGRRIQIGNEALLSTPTLTEDAARLSREFKPTLSPTRKVVVLCDEKLVAAGLLVEPLRDSTKMAVDRLRELGIECSIMTGDPSWDPEAIQAASMNLGIPADNIWRGLLPKEKADRVAAWEKEAEGIKVLFVGDGINDAPAMREATASLAMGSGAEVSRETASGELFGGDLRLVAEAVAVAKETVRAIRSNMLFAYGYNTVGIGLAAAGLLHPLMAAFVMLASSVTVSWRALRPGKRVDNKASTPSSPDPDTQGRKPADPLHLSPSRVSAALLALQGPALVWMGSLQGWVALGVVGAAVSLAYLATRTGGLLALMLAVGNLGMLIGWWVDAGLGPVIREDVCLCGCPGSTFGWGLLTGVLWMDMGMMIGAIGVLGFSSGTMGRIDLPNLLVCLLGMLAGMKLGALVVALVPVADPRAQFLLTFVAMVVAMMIGMRVAVGIWQRLSEGKRSSLR